MEVLILMVVAAANIIFILFKVEKKRYSDALLDTALLITVTTVASGSYAGLVVATGSSLLISIYLYAKPPKLPAITVPKDLPDIDIEAQLDSFVSEFKRKAARRSK
jgi:hypothetical protein